MSPLVDDGDLDWSPASKRGRSTKRKSIRLRNLVPLVTRYVYMRRTRSPSRAPLVPLYSRPGGDFHPNPNGKCGRCGQKKPSTVIFTPTDKSGDIRSRKCAFAALRKLNETTADQGFEYGIEYEFVEVAGCVVFKYPWIYHCNFIARPICGSQSSNRLCFAEVEAYEKEGKGATLTRFKCHSVCILGPST